MRFVYVLKSQKFEKSYVGMTDNLERRLGEHNEGKHSYTKKYVPWEILYSERLSSQTEARKRELYLKSAAGRRFLKKHVFKDWEIV